MPKGTGVGDPRSNSNPRLVSMEQTANNSGWKTDYASDSSRTFSHPAFPGQLSVDSYGVNKDNPAWQYTVSRGVGRAARTSTQAEGQGIESFQKFLTDHTKASASEEAEKLAQKFAGKVSIPGEYAAKARNDMQFVSKFPDVMQLLQNRPLKELAYVSKQPGNDTLATYNAHGANHGSYRTGSGRVAVKGSDMLDYQGQWKPAPPNSYAGGIHNVGGDLLDLQDRSGSTLLHEIGHHVQEQYAPFSGWGEASAYQMNINAYVNAVGNDRDPISGRRTGPQHDLISRYAGTNSSEYFAENFAAYHIYPDRLKNVDPDGYAVIDKVVKENQKLGYL
jgi:hypothetical protein